MKECAGKLFGRIGARLKKGAVIGTGAVLIASQVLSVVPAPTAAYAASSETITRGERVNYGGYYMYNSTTSEGTPAICLDPGKRHPLDATTATAQLPIETDWTKCYTGGGGDQTRIDRTDGMARSSTTVPRVLVSRRRRQRACGTSLVRRHAPGLQQDARYPAHRPLGPLEELQPVRYAGHDGRVPQLVL